MEKSLSLAFTFTPQGVACTVTEPESGETETVTCLTEYAGRRMYADAIAEHIRAWIGLWLDEYDENKEESK